MRVIADLHLHSKYSRATSRDMDIEHLARWGKLKGLTLLGTGDFTHPVWFRELRARLTPTGRGLFTAGGMHFVLSVEVANIYPQGGRLRKIHNILLAPSFETAERINAVLGRFGSLIADGRPSLSLPSDKLVEYVMELDPQCLVIPAHVWTPWFSLYGSNSGFDSLEECFKDQTRHIAAVETGLSSDPPMNWRLSELDRVVLVSDRELEEAAVALLAEEQLVAEPSGIAGLAALLRYGSQSFGQRLCVVVSGANASPGFLQELFRRAADYRADSWAAGSGLTS